MTLREPDLAPVPLEDRSTELGLLVDGQPLLDTNRCSISMLVSIGQLGRAKRSGGPKDRQDHDEPCPQASGGNGTVPGWGSTVSGVW